MNAKWKRELLKMSIWLMGEICMNLSGLDTIADYGEFTLQHKIHSLENSSNVIAVYLATNLRTSVMQSCGVSGASTKPANTAALAAINGLLPYYR